MVREYQTGKVLAFLKIRTGPIDFPFGKSEHSVMAKPTTPLSDYRKREGLSLEAFAALVGKSKGHMHEVESTMKCTASLALEIERVTEGAIDAGTLNEEVALARRSAAA
jgi:hypothetical protein